MKHLTCPNCGGPKSSRDNFCCYLCVKEFKGRSQSKWADWVAGALIGGAMWLWVLYRIGAL